MAAFDAQTLQSTPAGGKSSSYMGCSASTLEHSPPNNKPLRADPALRMDHQPDAAAVADLQVQQYSEAARSKSPPASDGKPAAPPTTMQDLPPLLLLHIFSKYLDWEDVHGSVSLVCQSWRQIAAEVTPHKLSLEFDLVDDPNPSTDNRAEGKSLLQVLLSQPSKLLQRLTGQLRPHADAADAADTSSSAAELLQQQQFMQFLQNAPWQRWLQAHGMQLQEFSMCITNLDSNCAAAQCQLKETLLRALADSAAADQGLSPSSSFVSNSSASSSCSSDTARATSNSNSDAESTCTSAPETPLSTSCSEFSECSSSGGSCNVAGSVASCSTSSRTISTLRLTSLNLKVPLFESDVLLLANGVCAKAPELKSLSLVGYSSSGAVKTRTSTGLSSSKASKHRLPIHKSGSSSGAATLAEQAAAAAAAGSNGIPRGGDLIPVGYTTPAVPFPMSQPSGSGRGGFITGSSLKQLMSATPQLQSLTFACRQLYKLYWLAPATELTHLSLRDCSLAGDLVKQLAGLNLPKLRAVDLSGSKGLGGAGAEEHLQQLTRIAGGKLEQVDISGWDLSTTGRNRELPHLDNLQGLSVLKLECCGLVGWAPQAGKLPKLLHLSLSGNPLDSRGIAAACSLTQLSTLELAYVSPKELALLPQQQPGQGPTCWSGMQPLPHLTSLNLAGNYWPDTSLPDRSPVLAYRTFKHNLCSSITAMPNLARIDLTQCKAPCFKTCHLLASLPPSVIEVVMDGAVDGIKRADIDVLQQLPRLQVLSACGCMVRDKHASLLCRLTGLHTLLLRDNALTSEGLSELLQGCSQLRVLDVSGNERVGGKACHSRPEALSHPQLLLVRDP